MHSRLEACKGDMSVGSRRYVCLKQAICLLEAGDMSVRSRRYVYWKQAICLLEAGDMSVRSRQAICLLEASDSLSPMCQFQHLLKWRMGLLNFSKVHFISLLMLEFLSFTSSSIEKLLSFLRQFVICLKVHFLHFSFHFCTTEVHLQKCTSASTSCISVICKGNLHCLLTIVRTPDHRISLSMYRIGR